MWESAYTLPSAVYNWQIGKCLVGVDSLTGESAALLMTSRFNVPSFRCCFAGYYSQQMSYNHAKANGDGTSLRGIPVE